MMDRNLKILLVVLVCAIYEAHAVPGEHPGPTKKGTTAVQFTPSKKESPTTIKTEIIEVARIEEPVPQPSKSPPLCIEPYLLGVPSIGSCRDIQLHGLAEGTLVKIDVGLKNCELVDDLSCDDGSGDGIRAYQQRLSKQGATVVATNPGVGNCLTVERSPDNSISVASRIRGEVLCCRALCVATTTTSTSTTTPYIPMTAIPYTTTSTRYTTTRESLLSLEEPTTYRPPSIPASRRPDAMLPQVDYPAMPTIPTVTTTPAPLQGAAFASQLMAEMCVMPQFLNLPRVASCQDFRDISMSTSYVHLTNSKAMDCQWIEDTTCGPNYPGLGAFLDAGTPNNACVAIRQDVCNTSIVGPYPILNRHMKTACQGKGSHSSTMVPMTMMVPVAPGKKGVRRLQRETDAGADGSSDGAQLRLLHGKNSGGKKGSPGSDTMVVCCRLRCSQAGGIVAATSQSAAAAVAAVDGQWQSGEVVVKPPSNRNENASTQTPGSVLCDPRFAQVCSLATPLRGEKIIFDQRCAGSIPLPGCYAGGISPCCRSVNMYEAL